MLYNRQLEHCQHAAVLIEVYMVFVLYASRYHQKGQYVIGEQTILENQYTTDHLVKNEAYMAHSDMPEEMNDEKGDLLEKDE